MKAPWKVYNLFITFATYSVEATKEFRTEKEALYWAQLCLDICGNDCYGAKYTRADLFDTTETGAKCIKTYN